MTAKQIADELEKRNDQYLYAGFYNKLASTMLRQQSKEIEELKEQLENCICQDGQKEKKASE